MVSGGLGALCSDRIQIEDIQQVEAGKLKVSYRTVRNTKEICITRPYTPVHIVVAKLAANTVQTQEFVALADATDVSVTSIDIVELCPHFDRDGQTARLAAVVAWTAISFAPRTAAGRGG